MQILYLLIPLSLVFLVVAIVFFRWAVNSSQFDDLEGPAHRIIFDDREILRGHPNPSMRQVDSESESESESQNMAKNKAANTHKSINENMADSGHQHK